MCPNCNRGLTEKGELCTVCAGTGVWNPQSVSQSEAEAIMTGDTTVTVETPPIEVETTEPVSVPEETPEEVVAPVEEPVEVVPEAPVEETVEEVTIDAPTEEVDEVSEVVSEEVASAAPVAPKKRGKK